MTPWRKNIFWNVTEIEKTPEGKVKFSAKIFSHNKNGKPIIPLQRQCHSAQEYAARASA